MGRKGKPADTHVRVEMTNKRMHMIHMTMRSMGGARGGRRRAEAAAGGTRSSA